MQFSRAEVWNDLSQCWSPGFSVVEENERGYRLRRRSDGSLLPYEIAKDKVRAAEF
jgi:biotin operon repressor